MNSYIILFSILYYCGVFAPKNVKNAELVACSTGEMATTGFTRNGKCGDPKDSIACPHTMCVDIPNSKDFCSKEPTNWCAQEVDSKKIENWCVCHWTFSTYVKLSADNCDKIQIVCDASSYNAITALDAAGHTEALECLKKKCAAPVEAGEQPAENGEKPGKRGEQAAKAGEKPAKGGENSAEGGKKPAEGEKPEKDGEKPEQGGEKAGENASQKGEKPVKGKTEAKVQADFEDAFVDGLIKKHTHVGIAGMGVIAISIMFWSYYRYRSQKTIDYNALTDGDEI